jgi:signal peptide peptidase SppA
MYGDVWAMERGAYTAAIAACQAGIEPKAQTAKLPRVQGSVGILPLTGTITQRTGSAFMEMFFGGTKTDAFGAAFDQMMAATEVGAVVLDIDSPGGTSFGVAELADKIRAARGTKPIIGVVNSLAASAAYWIASAADTLVVTTGGAAGSIGVFIEHVDLADALAADGINVTLIHAGKFKVEGNPFEPLSDEARDHLQGRVDAVHEQFVGAVAKGRGVTGARVKSDFGQGRVVMAAEALQLGMVDSVNTLEGVIGELTASHQASKRRLQNRAAVMGTGIRG